MFVAPADAIALAESLYSRTDGLDDTAALVAEYHILLAVVLIGSTEARGGDAQEDLVGLELVGLGGSGPDY